MSQQTFAGRNCLIPIPFWTARFKRPRYDQLHRYPNEKTQEKLTVDGLSVRYRRRKGLERRFLGRKQVRFLRFPGRFSWKKVTFEHSNHWKGPSALTRYVLKHAEALDFHVSTPTTRRSGARAESLCVSDNGELHTFFQRGNLMVETMTIVNN